MMMSFGEWGPAVLLGILPPLAACNLFTETAGAGEFSANVEARSVDRPSCVEMRAEPPEASSLMAATDTIRASWVLPGRAVPAYYVLVVLYPE